MEFYSHSTDHSPIYMSRYSIIYNKTLTDQYRGWTGSIGKINLSQPENFMIYWFRAPQLQPVDIKCQLQVSRHGGFMYGVLPCLWAVDNISSCWYLRFRPHRSPLYRFTLSHGP
jgi:hypothetical protein